MPVPSPEGLLLDLAQGMFAAAWGEEARFTPDERKVIQPPLGRILQRMSPEDATRFAAFADPVFLVSGLLVWGMRVWALQQKRPERVGRPQPVPIRHDVPVTQGIPNAVQATPEHRNGGLLDDIRRDWGAS